MEVDGDQDRGADRQPANDDRGQDAGRLSPCPAAPPRRKARPRSGAQQGQAAREEYERDGIDGQFPSRGQAMRLPHRLDDEVRPMHRRLRSEEAHHGGKALRDGPGGVVRSGRADDVQGQNDALDEKDYPDSIAAAPIAFSHRPPRANPANSNPAANRSGPVRYGPAMA